MQKIKHRKTLAIITVKVKNNLIINNMRYTKHIRMINIINILIIHSRNGGVSSPCSLGAGGDEVHGENG